MINTLKKRLFTFLVATTVATTFVVSASAVESTTEQDYSSLPNIGEIGPEFPNSNYNNEIYLDSEILSANSPEEVTSILKNRYLEKISSISKDDLDKKLSEIKNLSFNLESKSNDYVVSKQTIVLKLCSNDGIALSDLYSAYSLSDKARELAEAKYNDGGGYQDSYRHFTWNHMMADQMGSLDARTIACNYEWQAVILDDVEDVYSNAFEKYIIMPGIDAASAVILAYNDSMDFALELRNLHIAMCEADFSYFKSLFENPAIRDFWNNCYGRSYASKYSYNYDTAFSVANSNWELINNDSAVSYNNAYNVWSWDWFTP